MRDGCEKSSTIVQCLLKYWIKAWNDCETSHSSLRLQSVFAEGDGAIDVRDEAFGHVITASSFAEYETKWRAATDALEKLTFSLASEPRVDIDGDRADIAFELIADCRRVDGAPLDAQTHWRAAHQWRKLDGEWRIVRERLSAL